jgi:hypothetical protein
VLAGLATISPFPHLHWISTIILGLAIFVLRERPFVKAGYAPAFETSVAALLGLVFLGYFGWVTLVPRFEAEEIASKPCAPQNIEARCYSFSKENCSSLWTHFEQECRDEVKRTITSRRATALTGPIVRKCTYKRLDQAFHANRRSPVDPECQAHFDSLDSLSNQ